MDYTNQLFIFDSITTLIIIAATIYLFAKSRELYKLSLQKGLKYLNNAMFFFLISFSVSYVRIIVDFQDRTFGTIENSFLGVILLGFNLFPAMVGGYYLGYSLLWRKFEKDRIKRFHPERITVLYSIVAILVLADIYLMVKLGSKIPFIFFILTISFILYAIYKNFELCRKYVRHCQDTNPFMSLVGLGLGVYIAFFVENLLVNTLFTIHYYAMAITVVFTLAFVYNFVKLWHK